VNLLLDPWLPVRPVAGGRLTTIPLPALLCGEQRWELCCTRDDCELAALALAVCLTQTMCTPPDLGTLRERIARPLDPATYGEACRPYTDWFDLGHQTHPFFQTRGTQGETTPIARLLPGCGDSTVTAWVNAPQFGDALCAGCTAIALFQRVTASPTLGRGYKVSLRGGAPITTLVEGSDLRTSLWLNVLAEGTVATHLPWHARTAGQPPTWIEPIDTAAPVLAASIGLVRGLFWCPAQFELDAPTGAGTCAVCGRLQPHLYRTFVKRSLPVQVTGTWPHPHTPYWAATATRPAAPLSFGRTAPAWTQLAGCVLRSDVLRGGGTVPAAVIQQVHRLYGPRAERLHIALGGYTAKITAVTRRRHERVLLNAGWHDHPETLRTILEIGLGIRTALARACATVEAGLPPRGETPRRSGTRQRHGPRAIAAYYRRSTPLLLATLATISYTRPEPALARMAADLSRIAVTVYEEITRPYRHLVAVLPTIVAARLALRMALQALTITPQVAAGSSATREESDVPA